MSESNNNNYNIDEKIKDFSNYLLDIGLLMFSNHNDFVNKFKEINEKEKIILDDEEPDENYDKIYFKENLSKTLLKFYDSLNEDKKKLISYNIYNIYCQKKSEKNNNELTEDNFHIDKNEIIDEEGTEKKINNNNNKKEYKEEHFEICIYSQKNNLILKLSDNSESNESKNFLNKKKKKKKKNNSPSKKNEKKNDKDKLNLIQTLNENCTFQPNYEKKEKKQEKKNMKNIKEFFDKLSQKNTKREKDVADIKKDLEKECPFQPNLTKNKIKKELTRKDFEERMKRFEENKKEKEKRLKKDQEEEFKKICPFIPNNNNKKRSNSFNKTLNQTSENIYKRLHDENKLIQKKYEENLQKLLNDIKDRANHPIVNHNNIRYLSKRKYGQDKKIYNIKNNFNFNFNLTDKKYFTEEKKEKEEYKTFNSKRIEELYEEYKKMKSDIMSKNNKTEINVDVPSININKENNINNDKENLNLKQNEIINNEEKNN